MCLRSITKTSSIWTNHFSLVIFAMSRVNQPVITTMADNLEDIMAWEDQDQSMEEEVSRMTVAELKHRTRLIENEIKIMRGSLREARGQLQFRDEIIESNERLIEINQKLPYIVSNVVELLDVDEENDDDGAVKLVDLQGKRKSAVVKTSMHQIYFLPIVGLVDPEELKPGDLVGIQLATKIIMEKLPAEFDPRVKAMEVIDLPNDKYTDIGGLDKQIQELIEAVVLPITHKHKFQNLGIQAPKGVLLYGPPGTGKTLLARVKSTNSIIRILCNNFLIF